MKLIDAINNLGATSARKVVKNTAMDILGNFPTGMKVVFNACCNNLELIPTIKQRNGTEADVIKKWVDKYISGYKNRISSRHSNLPATSPDPMVNLIIKTRLIHLNQKDLESIKSAHRLSMSAENILGLFLEEYLAVNIERFGWHFAWGETIKSVDFCHDNGSLFQIKNRSNSENSSSSQVRRGTTINKWHRSNAITGEYYWGDLNNILGTNILNEESFRGFVIEAINNNPNCLAIEPDNHWLAR